MDKFSALHQKLSNVTDDKDNMSPEKLRDNLSILKGELDKFEKRASNAYMYRCGCHLFTLVCTTMCITSVMIPLITYLFISAKPTDILLERLHESTGVDQFNKDMIECE